MERDSADVSKSHVSSSTKRSRLADGLSALRHRGFRRLWIGTLASNVGSWAQKVATAWLIYRITNSEAWLGIDAFASGFPTVLLLPWGGVISDRVDRRNLLIWTNAVSAALAFALAALALAGALQIWHIILVSALAGCVQALMAPASTSILPTLVGAEGTTSAIALNSLQFNVSRIVGPAVGGLTLVYLGPAASFALNGVSFLVMVIALVQIAPIPAAPPKAESVWRYLLSGFTFVRDSGNIRVLLMMVMLAAFLGAPMISMMPALTKSVLHRDASTYSLMLSCFGLGAVVAAAVVALDSRHSPRPCRAVPYLIVYGACLIGVGYGLPIGIVVLLVTVSGFAFINTMIRLGTALLRTSPDEYRGRVTSLQSLGFRLGQPLGALVAGLCAGNFGIGVTFGAFGLLMIATVLLAQQTSTSLRTHKLVS